MNDEIRTADVVLHPVRLRVIQSLMGDRHLTTAQIAGELADVSPATLYRHIATLVTAGILEIVDERRVRGAVERTYSLQTAAAEISASELAALSAEEHRRLFAAYTAGLLGRFDAYLSRSDVDLVRDRVGYRHVALWLSDEEFDELASRARAVVEEKAKNGPGEHRILRMISTVVMPVTEHADED